MTTTEPTEQPIKSLLELEDSLKLDRLEFRKLLLRKHFLVTAILILVGLLSQLILTYLNNNFWLSPTAEQLIKVGALSFSERNPNELWRAFSNPFCHWGVIHLLVNLVTLAFVGPYVDYMCGRVHVFAVFVLGCLFSNLLAATFPSTGLGLSFGTTSGLFALLGNFLIYMSQLEKRTAPGKFTLIWTAAFVVFSLVTSVLGFNSSLNSFWLGFLFGMLYGISGIYFNFHSFIPKTIFISSVFVLFSALSYSLTSFYSHKNKLNVAQGSAINFKEFEKLFSEYKNLRAQFHQKIKSVSSEQDFTEFENWALSLFSDQLDLLIKNLHNFKSVDRNIYDLQLKTFNDMAAHKRILWESKNKKILYPPEAFASNYKISLETSEQELEELHQRLSAAYLNNPRAPANEPQ